MTTTDKPSIAELQQLAPKAVDVNGSDDDWFGSREAIIAAAPVLLEIAAAAKELEPDLGHLGGPLSARLREALAGIEL